MNEKEYLLLQNITLNVSDVAFDADDKSTVLGEGAFGKVVTGRFKTEAAAFKVLRTTSNDAIKKFLSEAMLHNALRHENILTCFGVVLDGAEPAMVMEFCALGTLRKCLSDSMLKLTWKEPKKRWAEGIARGMAFCHAYSRDFTGVNNVNVATGIVHRDLKPDNILISAMFTAKIADFGESRQLEENADLTVVGTADFTAPEVITGEKYDKKVDVYSFGIMMAEMVTHKKPYEGVQRAGLQHKIIAEDLRPIVPTSFKHEWPDLLDLMKKCWDRDPRARPEFVDVAAAIQRAEQGTTNNSRIQTFAIYKSAEKSGKHGRGTKVCDECNQKRAENLCKQCPARFENGTRAVALCTECWKDVSSCFVLFCFVLFCFVLFCFVSFHLFLLLSH